MIIVAGGSGTRMGGPVPKQFLKIGGKAILQLTIEKFIEAVPDIKVITVLPECHMDTWKQYCSEYNFVCPQTLVAGGISRFHSVKNGLEKAGEGLIAVHDGVRPLLSAGLIRRLFDVAGKEGSAIPVIPFTDTVKMLDTVSDCDGNQRLVSLETKVDRSNVFGAQTPQIFRSDILGEAYRCAYDLSFTDDASVAEAKKIPLSYVVGERFNIKITTKEDLVLAEAIEACRR